MAFLRRAPPRRFAELAHLADDPVAGDQEGDGVVPHRIAHRAGPAGQPDEAGQVLVAHRTAQGDAQQGLPDLDLEVGAAHVQVQRRGGRPGPEGKHPRQVGRGQLRRPS